MGNAYKIQNEDDYQFVTFRIVAWVDLFTRPCYKNTLVDSLNYCIDKKGLNVHAWVIMSNHFHGILSSQSGRLSDTIRDLKTHTSKQFIELMVEEHESRRTWMMFQFRNRALQKDKNIEYKVWESGYHAVALESERWVNQRMNYIHNNPVKAEIVDEPWHYRFSSARDYEGKPGLVKIDPIWM